MIKFKSIRLGMGSFIQFHSNNGLEIRCTGNVPSFCGRLSPDWLKIDNAVGF